MSKTVLGFFLAMVAVLSGCANSYDSRSTGPVPVSELGSRGAQFAGQAQQFHQANMSIDPCPQGTIEKTGKGTVNSGAGDQNGKVTYSVTTTSTTTSKCDFSKVDKVSPQKQVVPATQVAPTAQAVPAEQPATKTGKTSRRGTTPAKDKP